MDDLSAKLSGRIADAFGATGFAHNRARDLAFHMTDWLDDLDEIQALYGRISEASDEEVRKSIIRFLAHVPNHIAAAKKLAGLGPIEDIFELGVDKEDE